MRAIAFDEFGGPEVLRLVEIPAPEPDGALVRVKVAAAGVNPADWKTRSGALNFGTVPFPQYPGIEIAGVVDAVGPAADRWVVGDEVFGWSRNGRGGYAQYALAEKLSRKPAGLSFLDAVALPVAVSTAGAVLDLLQCRPGETLLINGAAGAVGSMAVQLAHADGVTVIGTSSAANQHLVAELGAIPTTYGDGVAERVRALAPRGVDAVFDAAGFGFLPAAIELRGGTARIVTIADAAAGELGVAFHSGDSSQTMRLLHDVAEGLVNGEFRLAAPARPFPLAQAAAAQQESQSGHGPGKIVLTL